MSKGEEGSNTTKKGKSSVPAVEKALDVLELLASAPDGLTMNEIVDALGRTMGEIYRVVVYLADRDYLSQNHQTGRYALTLRLFELSHRHDPTARLIHAALPILERVAAATNQSCHLGVLNRANVLVLASVHSPLPAGYSVRTGALFPVEQTSSGHVLLAFSSNGAQDRYLARLPASNRAVVQDRLTRIRETGYEDTSSKMIHGVRNLCVPVFDTRGVTAAITSGYIAQVGDAATAEQTLSKLRVSAVELSKSLGFRLAESPFEAVLKS
ncbi:IclR family transcriptional regulator [uncultured Litoreibacter sp.]|uniref:IclR family transcriptional regulator n=1 Tax=uncultured Litoreibacter sp. TaxID=1392394 RepID=UPI00262AD176|nr:IclR family transcriptional regulator [uncultured Litoreibacter sp.]